MSAADAARLVLLAIVWGAALIFLRIAAPVLGPILTIDIRLLVAGFVLLPVCIFAGDGGTLRRRWRDLVAFAVINSITPFFLYAWATQHITASFAGIINATVPLFGAIVARVWLKDRLNLQQVVGLVLGFVGVVVLIGWKPLPNTLEVSLGIAAAILGSLGWAIGTSFAKKRLSDVSGLTLATGSQLFGGFLVLPLAPFFRPLGPITPVVVGAMLGLALFSTALAYLIFFRLLRDVGPAKALTTTYMIPIFTIVGAAVFLGEPVTLSMVGGCMLVLAGIALATEFVKVAMLRGPSTP
jgi:drug/metabolite transporter (DMT)-like permease